YGQLFPTVMTTLATDQWSPDGLVAVAPFPGVVLDPNTSYAVVLTTDLRAEDNRPILRADAMTRMARGDRPEGPNGDRLIDLYSPLWPALDQLGVDRERAAVASVFTTGDVVADLAELADRAQAEHTVAIEGVHVDPDDGADHDRYCELIAHASVPQFQTGAPPFHDQGVIELDPSGAPIVQRYEQVRLVLTVPRTPMPAAGYPLVTYYHGSGGAPDELVDRGRRDFDQDEPVPGSGPAHVVAEHGIAGFAPAMPLAPDRLPGASEQEYLNFGNLGAFPSTFQQGVIEERLLLDAVVELEIPAAQLAACDLPTTDSVRFDGTKLLAMGQSMGGMYTNMIAATDSRIQAAVPTGAGGFWNWQLLGTEVVEDIDIILGLLFEADGEAMEFAHPALALLALAWEPAEPMVFMPRVSHRPLAGHPARSVYQPIGLLDIYFPSYIYDAAVLAYGNQLAGDEVWEETRESLALAGLDQIVSYPAHGNRSSEDGTRYTGIAVQYRPDHTNGHYIYAQLDEVKYQYGCFFASVLANGQGTVPAPAPLGTPCPE
ncbi:MAG: hypothetical protein KJO07_18260, partial [Deltaproteobacteria bacterium]|nr:hypothetical protein [Deltaproteobacteria bacterium]